MASITKRLPLAAALVAVVASAAAAENAAPDSMRDAGRSYGAQAQQVVESGNSTSAPATQERRFAPASGSNT